MREEFIATALSGRFDELCRTRAAQLAPDRFGDDANFVSQIREQLINTSVEDLEGPQLPGATWTISETDCLSSLRALSVGQSLQLSAGVHPPIDAFCDDLSQSQRDPDRRFQLLTERYACPLNFGLPLEDEIRERVLTRLMVQDRSRIEAGQIGAPDDLLLRLNLVALYAQATSDLRFLDALNFYFELIPPEWIPRGRHGWLLATYFALYARALAVRIRGTPCA